MMYGNDVCMGTLAKALRERKQVLFIGSHPLLIEQRKQQFLQLTGGYIGIYWTTPNQLADHILEASGKAYVRIDQATRQDLVESVLLSMDGQGQVNHLRTGLKYPGMYRSIALWIEDLEKGGGRECLSLLKKTKDPVLRELTSIYENYLICLSRLDFPYKETEQVFQIASGIVEEEQDKCTQLGEMVIMEGVFPDSPELQRFLEVVRSAIPESFTLHPLEDNWSAKSDRVRLKYGNTAYEEVRVASSDIQRQMSLGYREDEILIVTPNSYYSQLVKRELYSKGIKVHGTKNVPMLNLSVSQRILSLLELRKKDWERETLLKCARLHGAFEGLLEEEIAWGRKIIEESGVLTGFSNWMTLFRGNLARSKIRLEYLDGDGDTVLVEQRRVSARKWFRFLVQINRITQHIAERDSWGNYLDHLLSFIEKDERTILRSRNDSLQVLHYESLRNCIRTRYEIVMAFPVEAGRKISLERFMKWLTERLSTAMLPIGREENGIQVYNTDEIYGVTFPKVYVLGLIEDVWPRSFDPHWIWDLCKREEAEFGLKIPNASKQELEDRKLFEWAVSAGGEKLVLFSSLRNERGHATTLSRYVTEWLGYQERIVNVIRLPKKDLYRDTTPVQFFDQHKPISVTGINTYAKCPFKYWASGVLHVGERIYRKNGLLPIDKGSLLHRVFRELVENPVFSKEELTQRAEFLVEEEFRRLESMYGFSGPKWEVQCRMLKRDLLEFAAREGGGLLKQEGIQHLAEWGFGRVHAEKMAVSSSEQPLLLKWEGLELWVSGSIDRVDLGKEGFWVLDYKLSSGPSRRDIEHGRDLQMALYLLAYSQLSGTGISPLGGQFAVVRNPGEGGNVGFDSPEDFAEYAERINDQLFELVKQMLKGDVAPRPRERSECQNCSFLGICRRDEYGYRRGEVV
ncbi:exodeoxyribonuclease V subunit gamma [Fodinisporobacter ferrooxydans]|uniref:Exodeoxyribonuclease V subunit gamma n=1 Tax=Fodinisporobacter ferrooxydans TaxID=2901836 RepID=A0ABY4CMG5_9BACL|nr:exodeoxyribonuclease V subunit gamma [Alicyclobacillaceae bacterium MYW30-H2]